METSSRNHLSTNETRELINDERIPSALKGQIGVLNPVDRISGILFGLIMALSFTCTISVAETGRSGLKNMLFAAVGCNLAWGLVDAVMYVLSVLAQRGHSKTFLNFLHKTGRPETARAFIANELPPLWSSALESKDLEEIRRALLKIPEKDLNIRVTGKDFKEALAAFMIVFFSTIPVIGSVPVY